MRTVALVACAIVAVSFALFALDATRDASERSAAPVAGLEGTGTADPTSARRFARVADGSSSTWLRRDAPAKLALLDYGLGLPFLARYTRGRA